MCSQAAANPVAQSQDRVGHRQVPVDDVIKLHRHLHREGPPEPPSWSIKRTIATNRPGLSKVIDKNMTTAIEAQPNRIRVQKKDGTCRTWRPNSIIMPPSARAITVTLVIPTANLLAHQALALRPNKATRRIG